MKDYHNLKSQCDVLLLGGVFEKSRNRCLEKYGLCPSHYLSATALSWDAMLSMGELDLISDTEIYLFFEKGMRDNISYISERYSIAKTKYLILYDPTIQTKYFSYLVGKNNLYSYTRSDLFQLVDLTGYILQNLAQIGMMIIKW